MRTKRWGRWVSLLLAFSLLLTTTPFCTPTAAAPAGANPVVSVSIETVTCIEKYDGSLMDYEDEETGEWVENAWFWYDVYPKAMTVTYQNGDILSGTSIEIYAATGEWVEVVDDQSYENQWGVGEHRVTATFMGVSADYTVSVVENPVISVAFVKLPAKTTYLAGECADLRGSVIRLTFKDGTYEDIALDWTIGDINYGIGYSCAYLQATMDLAIQSECFTEAGAQTVEIGVFGKTCACDVTVKENKAENLTIREKNGDLILSLHHTDGSVTELNALDFSTRMGDEELSGGYLITDQGTFQVKIDLADDQLCVEIWNPSTQQWLRSNALSESQWFTLRQAINSMISATGICDGTHFSGVINIRNIDEIIFISFFNRLVNLISMGDFEGMADIIMDVDTDHLILYGDEVKKSVLTTFGLDCDLRMSDYYDAESNTVNVYVERLDIPAYILPANCVSTGDGWTIRADLWDGTVLSIRFNKDFQIMSYDRRTATAIPGDVNNDGTVDTGDARQVLRYTAELLGDGDIDMDAADVNGDGKVDTGDARLLLQYAAEIIDWFPMEG